MEKQIEEYRRKFYQDYHRVVLPSLTEHESMRVDYLNKAIFWTVLVIIAIIGIGIYFVTHNMASMCIVLVVLLIIPFIIFNHYNSSFVLELKNSCMDLLLSCFGNVSWTHDKSIDDHELNISDLFANYNRRENDDNFSGTFLDVPFQITETDLIHESGSGKRRQVYQVFKGIVIKFKSNKRILNKTIVTTKGDFKTKRSGIWCIIVAMISSIISSAIQVKGKFVMSGLIIGLIITAVVVIIFLISENKNKERLNPIHLEDPDFDKKFNVYSSDEIEARYLLTTSFMERFLNLKTAFGARMAKCSFYDDNIMFAISTNKNLFEIGNIYHKLGDAKQIQKTFDELMSIFAMIDYFKLNQKLGL